MALTGLVACGSATAPDSRGSPARIPITSSHDAGAPDPRRGFVSAGHVLQSAHFQMISTVGPPSVSAGNSSSAHALLRAGLISDSGGAP